ncbi:MAG: hypothetical protein OHK0032_19120 [Thermodesulfovibrionales bacterium]
MLNVARVSVRGQIAVPKAVREKLGIKEGDVLVLKFFFDLCYGLYLRD